MNVHRTFGTLKNEVSIDRGTVELVAMFTLVMASSVYFAIQKQATTQAPDPAVAGSAAATGGSWVIAEVIFASLVVGVIVLVRKAPEWAATMAKRAGGIVGCGYIGAYAVSVGSFPSLLFIAAFGYMFTVLLDRAGVWWIFNNVIALALAVYLGVFMSRIFGVVGLLVALIGLVIYDYYFADEKEWMFDILDAFLKYKIPVLVVKPKDPKFRWTDLYDHLDERDGERKSGWGVGMADLAVPAGFAAAVATAPHGGVLIGGAIAASIVIAGTAISCLRLRHKMHAGGGAGLPSLSAGAIGGWVIAQVVLVV